MALRWLLHSTCHVLGCPKPNDNSDWQRKQIVGYPNGKDNHTEMKSFKGLPQERSVAMELDEYPSSLGFQMPLHYPRYTKADYENMDEWKIDLLLKEYGLSVKGTLDEKRAFAMGAFLWPDQY